MQASRKNNDNMPVSKKNKSDSMVIRFGIEKLAKKSKKLKNLFKFWKLAKSVKKLLKNRNSVRFDTKNARPRLLFSDTKKFFNHL